MYTRLMGESIWDETVIDIACGRSSAMKGSDANLEQTEDQTGAQQCLEVRRNSPKSSWPQARSNESLLWAWAAQLDAFKDALPIECPWPLAPLEYNEIQPRAFLKCLLHVSIAFPCEIRAVGHDFVSDRPLNRSWGT